MFLLYIESDLWPRTVWESAQKRVEFLISAQEVFGTSYHPVSVI